MPYVPKVEKHEKSKRLLLGYEVTASKLAKYQIGRASCRERV